MNRNRIDKMIKEASEMWEAVRVANVPHYAPWVEKAKRSYQDTVDRLNLMAKQARWSEKVIKQWKEKSCELLQAVLNDHWGWTLASLGLCGKPEPHSHIRWFRIFPDWFALIPTDLYVPALLELRTFRTKYTESNCLKDWLHDLSWERLTIPENLTQESMGIIIRTVVENADAVSPRATYCKKCALLYPTREGALCLGILPSCPHCGGVGWAYSHAFA